MPPSCSATFYRTTKILSGLEKRNQVVEQVYRSDLRVSDVLSLKQLHFMLRHRQTFYILLELFDFISDKFTVGEKQSKIESHHERFSLMVKK